MSNNKKFKLSFILIFGISVIIIALTLALSYISFTSVSELGKYAIEVDKKNIKDTATLLFLEITNRTAQQYSTYFENVSKEITLIADEVRGMNKSTDKINKEYKNNFNFISYKNKDFYIDSNYKDRIGVIYWGNKTYIPNTEKKASDVSRWFFPYIKNIMELNKAYYFGIWIFYPDCNLYMADTQEFSDEKFEKRFYNNIPGKDTLRNIFNKITIRTKAHTEPVWWKPYKGFSGELIFYISSPVYEEKTQKLEAVVGIDLRMNKVLETMDKAELISENSASLSSDWKSIYHRMEGFTFILNKNGDIFLFPESQYKDFQIDFNGWANFSLLNSKNEDIRKLASKMVKDDNGIKTVKLDGKNHIIAFSTIQSTGWILGFVAHESALMNAAKQTSSKLENTEKQLRERFILIAFIFLVLIITAVIIVFRSFIFKPLYKIRKEIRKMGSGSFDIKLAEGKTAEIAELTEAFNYLGKELQDYIKNLSKEVAVRQAFETEIELAGEMQKSILPNITKINGLTGVEIFSKLVPAKDVSGDFFDFFKVSDNQLAFLIADVSGKGMQAAFFMAMSKILIKTFSLKHGCNPGKVLESANNALSRDNYKCMFVTVFLGFYNIETGEIICSNGGHHDPILIENNGKVYEKEASNNELAVGYFKDTVYSEFKFTLSKGDTIVLYTDGVIDAVSQNKVQFGEKRLLEVIENNIDMPLRELADKITGDISNFEHGGQFDDITLVFLKRK